MSRIEAFLSQDGTGLHKVSTFFVIIVAALSFSMLFFALTNADNENHNEFEGVWEVASFACMDSDGTYYKDSSSMKFFGNNYTLDDLSINVKSVHNILFRGTFLNMKICGENRDGKVYFEYDAKTYHLAFQGAVKNTSKGTFMEGSMMYMFGSEVPANNKAYAMQISYLKAGTALRNSVASADVPTANIEYFVGKDMKCAYAYARIGQEKSFDFNVEGDLKLKFIKTDGMLFCASMEQYRFNTKTQKDERISAPIVGGLFSAEGDKNFGALAMDYLGRYYNIEVYDNKAVYLKCTGFFGLESAKDETCSVTCLYYMGDPDPSVLPEYPNLSGTEWMADGFMDLKYDGTHTKYNTPVKLTFYDFKNDTTIVRCNFLDINVDMAGVIVMFDGKFEVHLLFLNEKGNNVVVYVNFSEDFTKAHMISTSLEKPLCGMIQHSDYARV